MDMDGRRHIVLDIVNTAIAYEGDEASCRSYVQRQQLPATFAIYSPLALVTISRGITHSYEQTNQKAEGEALPDRSPVVEAEALDKLGRRIGKRRRSR